MHVEVIEPGLLTTVQDLGRWGYVQLGISTSGAMDPFASRAANALVGNEPHEACLEITLVGPALVFSGACLVAITGAELEPRIDGRRVESWRSHLVKPGSLLDFAGRCRGARAYLAVSGGIAVEPWLGSRSTYLLVGAGGLEGRALRTGDRLPVGQAISSLPAVAGREIPFERRPPYSDEPTLRVILGPHLDRFTEDGVNTLLAGSYRVDPASNRIGYRLEGPKLAHTRGADVSSCGIPLGGIQVPGNGQPIILMADHQMGGGYTMIATVIQADIPLVAQCAPGDRVRFRSVGLEDAREAYRRQLRGIPVVAEEAEGSLWEV